MTDTMTREHPQSLRAFLDGGGNPRDALGNWWESFIQDDYPDALRLPATRRADKAYKNRYRVDAFVRGESLRESPGTPEWAARSDKEARWLAWEADLLDDPSLGERLVPFDDNPARIRGYVEEVVHPHPLRVAVIGEPWTCEGCGTPFEAGTARGMTITEEDLLTYSVQWCAECVARAAREMQEATA